jgi:cytochrome P450
VALAATLEPFPSDRVQDAADEASVAFERYFTELIAKRRDDPGEDLLSRLIEVEQAGDGLTEKEVRHTASLVLGAGFETTTNLIGNGTLALLKNRDQWDALGGDDSLAHAAVEELLRYDSPVQMATPRVASEPIDTEEGTIQEGDTVVCVVGAANRDPKRYKDPASLDVRRPEPAPLSFGGGPHFCLGAALARMEGIVVFREMTRRLPKLSLVSEDPPWRETLNIRGLETLPVKVA